MWDDQDPPVGYKNPPKHSQFKKGVAQPKRQRQANQKIDVEALLSAPWKVGEGRGVRKVHPLELALLQLCKAAAKGNMRAAEISMDYFDRYGIIGSGDSQADWKPCLYVPYDHDPYDWHAKFKQFGPPPWPFEHDGVSRLAELRDAHQR